MMLAKVAAELNVAEAKSNMENGEIWCLKKESELLQVLRLEGYYFGFIDQKGEDEKQRLATYGDQAKVGESRWQPVIPARDRQRRRQTAAGDVRRGGDVRLGSDVRPMTSSADLAVKEKEAFIDPNSSYLFSDRAQANIKFNNLSGNQRPPYPSPRPAKDWDKLEEAQLKNESLSINESLKPAEGERYYNPSGPGRGGGGKGRSRVLRSHPVLTEEDMVLELELGWLGFFYAGIIGFLAFITSAAEHYSDKFIKTHWLKIQGSSAFLSYAGLVIWGVGVFAHGSTVLQIILWSLLLGLPIIGIMEYYRIKMNEFKFTSEEKKLVKDIEPTIKTLENVIHRYEDYQPLGEADQEFVARVFEHHPRKAEKLDGSQIKHFTVAGHGISKEVRSFNLVLKNGKMIEFSYHTCVRSYVQRRYFEEAEAFWKKYTKKRSYEVDKFLHNPTTEPSSTSVVPLTSEEIKVDKIVLSWIFTTLSDPLRARLVVARPKTAREAWSLIADIAKDNKRSRTNALKAELCSIKLGDQSMASYFQKIESYVNEEDAVHYAIEGLPDKYEQVIGYMHYQDKFPDLKTVRSLLIAEEMRLRTKALASPIDSSSPMVLMAQSGTNRRSSSQVKSSRPCFNFAKGSCRFGSNCRYVHDSNVKPPSSSTPSIANNVTDELLMKLLEKLGLQSGSIVTSTTPPYASNSVALSPGPQGQPMMQMARLSFPPPGFNHPLAQSPTQAHLMYTTAGLDSAGPSLVLAQQQVQPPPAMVTAQPDTSGPITTTGHATILPSAFTTGTLHDPSTGA
ncbi:ribonuclease H-like domain-containing protein [Tanacetum coccineum]